MACVQYITISNAIQRIYILCHYNNNNNKILLIKTDIHYKSVLLDKSVCGLR